VAMSLNNDSVNKANQTLNNVQPNGYNQQNIFKSKLDCTNWKKMFRSKNSNKTRLLITFWNQRTVQLTGTKVGEQ
jgi:hypothetical protein